MITAGRYPRRLHPLQSGFQVLKTTDKTVIVEIYREEIEIWIRQQGPWQVGETLDGWRCYWLDEKLYTLFALRWS
jgi:hypothetical protein